MELKDLRLRLNELEYSLRETICDDKRNKLKKEMHDIKLAILEKRKEKDSK